jgi:hypothetical protein
LRGTYQKRTLLQTEKSKRSKAYKL